MLAKWGTCLSVVQKEVVESGERMALEISQTKAIPHIYFLLPQTISFARYFKNQIQI